LLEGVDGDLPQQASLRGGLIGDLSHHAVLHGPISKRRLQSSDRVLGCVERFRGAGIMLLRTKQIPTLLAIRGWCCGTGCV